MFHAHHCSHAKTRIEGTERAKGYLRLAARDNLRFPTYESALAYVTERSGGRLGLAALDATAAAFWSIMRPSED